LNGEGDVLGTLVKVLVQIAGAILAGWLSFVVVDSADSAPHLAEGQDEGRAFIIVAVIVGFATMFTLGSKSETTNALCYMGTTYLLQAFMPGAVGDINTDVGRVVGASIYAAGGPELNLDLSGTWIFIASPFVGILGAWAYGKLEDVVGKMACGGAGGGADGRGQPAVVSQNVPQQSGQAPMIGMAQHQGGGFQGQQNAMPQFQGGFASPVMHGQHGGHC